MRRPIIRLAYCTGIRRCPCSTKMTLAMIASASRQMKKNVRPPWLLRIAAPSVGIRAAMFRKMSSDMPLPTPRSVMSSPSHIMTAVPAVIVRTVSVSV